MTVLWDSTAQNVTLVGRLMWFAILKPLAVYCEMKFSGSNWALVRHVPEGRFWHPARLNAALLLS